MPEHSRGSETNTLVTPAASGAGVELTLPGVGLHGVMPRASYRHRGRARNFTPLALSPGGPSRWTATDGRVELELTVTRVAAGTELAAAVHNRTTSPLLLDELTPLHTTARRGLELGGDPAGWSVFRNGWSSWSLVRRFAMDEPDRDPWLPLIYMTAVDPGTPRRGEPGRLRSELVTAVADPSSGTAVVLGFTGGAGALSVIDLTVDVAAGSADRAVVVDATCRYDGRRLGVGETVTSEPLLLAAGDDGPALLESWADAIGSAMAARVPARPPGGWCSWYYYFTSITEAATSENLAEMDRLGRRMPVDYVMVDDGHQTQIGDWLNTNDDFPSGMRAVADAITATGRDAGIWLAPFIVHPRSQVARAHPEWILRNDRGRPVRALWNPLWSRTRFMHVLDTTMPAVQEWLADVARTLRHQWGYRILKLDFCYSAALPARRWDPTATRASALRAGLEAVRAGAGDEAFLLGCGLPLGPAVGVVDGMRIGPDVAPFWNTTFLRWATSDQAGTTTEGALRSTLNRAFLHNRLWANDPDCLMVRKDRTRMTIEEIRTQVAIVGLTDGMLVASDRLDKVPDDRLDLLRIADQLAGGKVRVVDLLDRPFPELVVSEHDDVTYVGTWNTTSEPRPMSIDATALGLPDGAATEVFSGHPVTVRNGSADLGLVAPHDCRVLCFGRPPEAAARQASSPS